MNKILIIEDDEDINNLLKKIITRGGFQAVQAFSGTEAKLLFTMDQYRMILLDLALPGIRGEELIRLIRESCDVPILVISAKTALESKVGALNNGADDYLTKPFENEEVMARVNAALRRYGGSAGAVREETIKYKGVSLDPAARAVTADGHEVNLTSHEFDILMLLLQNPNRVFSRESIYTQVWNGRYVGEDNTINVHISNIRKKIAEWDGENEYIKTVWGIGFKLA